MIPVYWFLLIFLASGNGQEQDTREIPYFEELPEICREKSGFLTWDGDKILKFIGRCGLEYDILKIRHPDFPFGAEIPSTPVSEANCTYSKIMHLKDNDKALRGKACFLRGIIGKDPNTISNNEMRKTIKENVKKLLKTIETYPKNCSSAQFKNIDIATILTKIEEQDECIIILLMKHTAYDEELQYDNEIDINSDEKDEKGDDDDRDDGVMKVITEQVEGVLKLIKYATGNDTTDDGNIIIAYTNIFQIIPNNG